MKTPAYKDLINGCSPLFERVAYSQAGFDFFLWNTSGNIHRIGCLAEISVSAEQSLQIDFYFTDDRKPTVLADISFSDTRDLGNGKIARPQLLFAGLTDTKQLDKNDLRNLIPIAEASFAAITGFCQDIAARKARGEITDEATLIQQRYLAQKQADAAAQALRQAAALEKLKSLGL